MKASIVASQVALLIVLLMHGELSVDAALMLYFADLTLITIFFMVRGSRGTWFIDPGYFLLVVYTIYYPLTAVLLQVTKFGDISEAFIQLQTRYSLLFVTVFSLGYTILARPTMLVSVQRGVALFTRGYSTRLLIPIVFASAALRLGILWATAGFTFDYSQAYLGPLTLKASGLNIVNQIANVIAGFSTVALIILYNKEVANKRYTACIVTLLAFFIYSVYVGARTIFLAPLLTFIVVYGRHNRLRLTLRTAALWSLVIVFFFGLEMLRSSGGSPASDVIFMIGETFVIFTNGLSFFGGYSPVIGPELNSYVNDIVKIVPNYIYSTGLDISTWFMQEFFNDAYIAGSGRAFGFNTEAMINYGSVSIVFQGLSLAVLVALLTRLKGNTRRQKEYLEVLLVLFIINAYGIVRVSTFALLSTISSSFVAIVGIWMAHRLASRSFLEPGLHPAGIAPAQNMTQ